MNLAEITLQDAKLINAREERLRLREAIESLWQERDDCIENAMRWQGQEMFTTEQVADFDELALCAEYVEYICDKHLELETAFIPPLTATNDGPERYKMNGVYA